MCQFRGVKPKIYVYGNCILILELSFKYYAKVNILSCLKYIIRTMSKTDFVNNSRAVPLSIKSLKLCSF